MKFNCYSRLLLDKWVQCISCLRQQSKTRLASSFCAIAGEQHWRATRPLVVFLLAKLAIISGNLESAQPKWAISILLKEGCKPYWGISHRKVTSHEMLMLHMMLIIRIRLEGTSAQPLPHTSSGNRMKCMHVYVFTRDTRRSWKSHVVTRCRASDLSMSQGYTLLGYRVYGGGGEQVFRLDCQERDKWGGKEHPRREKKR